MPQLKVAYFMLRFPHLTETFILREMLFIREHEVDIHVFSLAPPAQTAIIHQQTQEIMPHVHYSPYLLSLNLILAHIYFLTHSPVKYWKSFIKALWQAGPDWKALGRVLILFPKTVYFAKQVKDLGIQCGLMV